MRSSSGSRREAGSAGRDGRSRRACRASSAGRRDDRPPLRHADPAERRDAAGDGRSRRRRRAKARGPHRDRPRGARRRPSRAGGCGLPADGDDGEPDRAPRPLGAGRRGGRRDHGARLPLRTWRARGALGTRDEALQTENGIFTGRAGARRRQPTGRPSHGADAGRLPREHAQRRRRRGLANRPPARGRCRGETARAPHPSRRGATHERRRGERRPPRQSTAGSSTPSRSVCRKASAAHWAPWSPVPGKAWRRGGG